jgi:hypothetical protein
VCLSVCANVCSATAVVVINGICYLNTIGLYFDITKSRIK